MLGIQKGPEPPTLREYREKTPDASYEGLPKEEVRERLFVDQGGLCAYCMRRVRYRPALPKELRKEAPDFTIEHWSAQSTSDRGLHWPDMLGVCSGRLVVNRADHIICDKARGNQTLTLHPVRDQSEIEGWCTYTPDGRIQIKNRDDDVRILNLNVDNLKLSRKVIWDLVVQRAKGEDLTGLRTELAKWEGRNQENLRLEYAGVATFLLRQVIKNREGKAARLKKQKR